ncbi:MAG TPA: aldehyde dehydrogenase family protein [Candidatus Thermoplasmatota archaeon]|nr:aldehyde dehydrogenase family protein [Candidatus Thermoplasmatota archaeon]
MKVPLDDVVRGTDGAAASALAARLNRFQNKNTRWRHEQNGTLAEFDRLFDQAVARLRKQLGAAHPLVIDGKEVKPKEDFTTYSPADGKLAVGTWAAGSVAHARKAVAAAKKGFPAWSATPWQERIALIEKAAELFTDHFYDLCAVMCLEAGKTRHEASIDVDEAIDFLRYYALTMREMGGFDVEMGKPFPTESCRSLRKPWGVFAVVCPFNFPVAITTGMTAAALITGNTAIVKPSAKGLLSGWWVYSLLREAGVPGSALHFLSAADHGISSELLESPEVDGLVFTGSKAIGMKAWQNAAKHGRPKPLIAEMGGKNAIVVSDKADLDKAVQGVFRSAFGYQGQKCSACSRVYVHRKVAKEFTERLVKLTEAARVGQPWRKETYMGPVIGADKLKLVAELAAQVKKDGGKVLAGGTRAEKDADGKKLDGNYMLPTIVGGKLPPDHRVFREEFFMPFVALHEVASFADGIREANAVEYGLTAGCFTEDEKEAQQFFATIEAGVTYLNRAAGGSTAAVVNGQAFVGWKNSGSTGNGAGGRYYLLQFTREQSQTIAA